jgi:hypothetical protein
VYATPVDDASRLMEIINVGIDLSIPFGLLFQQP